MLDLLYFLAVLYGLVGIGTSVYVMLNADKTRSNPFTALLAGAFWPLFWIVGQSERNRRMRGSNRGLLK
ncbi:MAG: hypothetical protein K1Y36_14690 [Blastocatellia bacterium]|nr:hypothetical protein [Blastocatellia bacterium]